MPFRLFLILSLSCYPGCAFSAVEGIVMVAKGQISLKSKNEVIQNAKVGTRVSEGDTVTTGPDSRAKIVMQDRNVINVGPDSELKIAVYTIDSEDKKVELNLIRGKVRNNVEQVYEGAAKSNFIIKTPTAVAGVRGTQFATSYQPDSKLTQVVTFKGSVQFSSVLPDGKLSAAVTIAKGQTSSVGPTTKSPDTPKVLAMDELQKADADSTQAVSRQPVSAEGANRSAASEDSKVSSSTEFSSPSMITVGDVGAEIARDVKDYRGTELPKSLDSLPPKRDRPKGPASDLTNIIRDQVGKTRVIIVPQ